MRNLRFRIYEEVPNGGTRPITNSMLTHVICEMPFNGAIIFTRKDGTELAAVRREGLKNETYDIYWTK